MSFSDRSIEMIRGEYFNRIPDSIIEYITSGYKYRNEYVTVSGYAGFTTIKEYDAIINEMLQVFNPLINKIRTEKEEEEKNKPLLHVLIPFEKEIAEKIEQCIYYIINSKRSSFIERTKKEIETFLKSDCINDAYKENQLLTQLADAKRFEDRINNKFNEEKDKILAILDNYEQMKNNICMKICGMTVDECKEINALVNKFKKSHE